MTKDGAQMIAEERRRQVEKEGWSEEHDDDHCDASLLAAAIAYAGNVYGAHPCGGGVVIKRKYENGVSYEDPWPESWSEEWDKRKKKRNPIRKLVIAGALIAAEIDRLAREYAADLEKPED